MTPGGGPLYLFLASLILWILSASAFDVLWPPKVTWEVCGLYFLPELTPSILFSGNFSSSSSKSFEIGFYKWKLDLFFRSDSCSNFPVKSKSSRYSVSYLLIFRLKRLPCSIFWSNIFDYLFVNFGGAKGVFFIIFEDSFFSSFGKEGCFESYTTDILEDFLVTFGPSDGAGDAANYLDWSLSDTLFYIGGYKCFPWIPGLGLLSFSCAARKPFLIWCMIPVNSN